MSAGFLRRAAAASLRALGRGSRGVSTLPDVRAPAIVFAPHPDDEALGCGGTIALKALAGATVKVAIMTDGRTSHAAFMDAATLVRTRREEALAASRSLGLSPSDYRFLDFEDTRLRHSTETAVRRVIQLLDEFQPRQVFVPHRRDRIPDHIATFNVVAAAIRAHGKPMTAFEYPVWLWNTWPWAATRPSLRQILRAPDLVRDIAANAFGCDVHVDIASVRQRKLDALAQYRSQMARPPGSPEWPIMADVANGTFLACFESSQEIFRRTELNAAES
jgi:LmbE family N-acetylglucosaminyl deacetylase